MDTEDAVEPVERFSSSDVVHAAEELQFSSSKSNLKNFSTGNTRWHALEPDEIANQLNSSINHGLSDSQITSLRALYGRNQLPSPAKPNWWLQFFQDAKLYLILASCVCCVVVYAFYNDILALTFGVLLFVLIGVAFCCAYTNFTTHAHQSSAFEKLPQHVPVIRNGAECSIDSTEVLPGDIIIVQVGNEIPADIRVVECSSSFQVDESAITGESEPKTKTHETCKDYAIQMRESDNMLWSGSLCIDGKAKGIVVATGGNTFLGQTAKLVDISDSRDHSVMPTLSKKCSLLMTGSVFALSVLCLLMYFIIGGDETQDDGVGAIGIIWFVVGFMIAVCCPCMLYCAKSQVYGLWMTELMHANVMCRSVGALHLLPDIGTLCFNEDVLSSRRDGQEVAIDLRQFFETLDAMNIRVVVVSRQQADGIKSVCEQCGYLSSTNSAESVIINGEDVDEHGEFGFGKRKRVIFANVVDSNKISIIMRKLKEATGTVHGETRYVCMVGSGSNDVVAMRSCDLSFSLGISATDVAKDASDIILLDDNLTSVAKTIEVSKAKKDSFSYKMVSAM